MGQICSLCDVMRLVTADLVGSEKCSRNEKHIIPKENRDKW